MVRAVQAVYPEVEVVERESHISVPLRFPTTMEIRVLTVNPNGAQYFPLLPIGRFRSQQDPLNTIATLLASANPGEYLALAVMMGRPVTFSDEDIRDYLHVPLKYISKEYLDLYIKRQPQIRVGNTDLATMFGESIGRGIWWLINKNRRVDIYDEETTARFEARMAEGLQGVHLALVMISPDRARFGVLDTLQAQLMQLRDPDWPLLNGFDTRIFQLGNPQEINRNAPYPLMLIHHNEQLEQNQMDWWQIPMSTEEIATFWHLPHKEMTAPKITRMGVVNVPPARAVRGVADGVFVGESTYGGGADTYSHPNRRTVNAHYGCWQDRHR